MESRLIIAFTLDLLAFLVGEVVPLNLGVVFYAFVCTLMFYVVGWRSFWFGFGLTFLGVFSNLWFFIGLGEVGYDVAGSFGVELVLPVWVWVVFVCSFMFMAYPFWCWESRALIRRLKLDKRLVGFR